MREKASQEISRDALLQAKRKLDDGCAGCAEGYARVAAAHGATRRDFLRVGLGGLAAAALAGGGLVAMGALAPKNAEAMDCSQDWECLFGQWVIFTRCCDWIWIWNVVGGGWWEYVCWTEGVDRTGLSCVPR
jgi:hypothetical protein